MAEEKGQQDNDLSKHRKLNTNHTKEKGKWWCSLFTDAQFILNFWQLED
jgi:hypothetical protein